jgi:excisionase family DNA binding protein
MHGSRLTTSGYVSATEAAELAGLSARTVRRWIADGRLPAVKRGRSFRISLADLSAATGLPLAPREPLGPLAQPSDLSDRSVESNREMAGLVHNLTAELLQATATAARWRTLAEVLFVQLEQTERRLAEIEERAAGPEQARPPGGAGRLTVETWRDLVRSAREPTGDPLGLDVPSPDSPPGKRSAS